MKTKRMIAGTNIPRAIMVRWRSNTKPNNVPLKNKATNAGWIWLKISSQANRGCILPNLR